MALRLHEHLFFLFFLGEITWFWPEKPFEYWRRSFLFLWRSPVFGRKNRLNFGEELFFVFGDHLVLIKKKPQSNSRLMKIWVKFVY